MELGSDESGTWLWMPDQTVVQTASGSFTATPGLRLFPLREMWSAYFVPAVSAIGRPEQVYVDITTVATRHGDLIEFVDLDLDVEQLDGGDVRVLDRDEFDQNAARWQYPTELMTAAEAACEWVAAAISGGWPPFGGSYEYWLSRAATI